MQNTATQASLGPFRDSLRPASDRRPWTVHPRLALSLLVAFAARLWVALTAPLMSQEAYHWAYASHPALSYFDHPPMVGWSIATAVRILGVTPFAIRTASLVFGLVITGVGVLLVRDLGGSERAQSLWVLASVATPILGLCTSLALIEAPLLCFWMLTLWALWRAREGGWGWFALAGAAAGGALLSKYSAIFLLPGGLLVLAFDPSMRRRLRSVGPWLAVVVSGLCFFPVVLWNAEHHWASFAFQAASRYRSAEAVPRRVLELVAGQAILLTPAVAVAIAGAVWWWLKRWRDDPRSVWVLGFGLPLPLFLTFQAPWAMVKINWLLPAYLALLPGAVLWWTERRPGIRGRRAMVLAGAALACGLAVMLAVPASRLLPFAWGNNWSGWEQIAAEAEGWEETLDGGALEERNVFFFSNGANEAAALWLSLAREHTEPSPLEPILDQNVVGAPGLAFDYWTAPDALAGFDAVAVLRDLHPEKEAAFIRAMTERFESVERVEDLDVRELGVLVQKVSIWICRSYRPPQKDEALISLPASPSPSL